MADPLSIGASVIAFIQLADSVIRLCRDCIEAIKDAPKDMQIIIGEVTSLKAIIESFSAVDLHANTIKLVPSLFEATGPVEACRRCLSALQRLLPVDIPEVSKGKLRKITFAELAWPMKQSRARKLLAEISGHKSTLLLAITGDMIHDIKDIRAGVQRIEFTITDSQRQEIIRWLETINPSSLHNTAFKKHEEHTSSWLLQSPEWINWLDRESPRNFLWIHGIPGSGKTVLASFIIEQLKVLCSDDLELGHAYYYCHYSHSQDEGTSFLKWIIAKLCRHATWIPAQLKELHDHGCEPSIPELENALEAILERFKMTYVVIDAVDESAPRDDLLAVIATIVLDKRFRNLKVLATSREYYDIERMFSGISESISMSNSLVEKDIRLFVHSRLLSSPLARRFKHLLNQIEDVLATRAQGMFRWAECQIHVIEKLRHESQILSALNNLPKDLAETYIRIFESIPEADRDFVHRVLIWICGHAGGLWMKDRGIDATLLVSAVSYDLAEASSGSGTFVYDCDDLRELCGCLITFSSEGISEAREISKEAMESSETLVDGLEKGHKEVGGSLGQVTGQPNLVSLAHYTVMEFLVSPLILKTLVAQFALDEVTIFNEFALSCIRQALSASPEGKSTDWERDREAYCLTLVCAFGLRFDYFANRSDIQDLWMQYYDPRKSHFARLPAIQERILHGRGVCSHYMLLRLPFLKYDVHTSTLTQVQFHAATMLNLLCAAKPELVPKFLEGKDVKELLEVRLFVQANRSQSEGTIPELLCQHARYSKGFNWLLRNYGTYVDATRLMMSRIGVHVGSGCNHRNTPDNFCMFNELLKLGADPSGSGFEITPLQLASYRCDYFAVKLLVDHGADLNGLGDVDGDDVKDWQQLPVGKKPALATLVSSCTPLRILKTCRRSRKGRGLKIERLLVENGARDNGFEGEMAENSLAI